MACHIFILSLNIWSNIFDLKVQEILVVINHYHFYFYSLACNWTDFSKSSKNLTSSRSVADLLLPQKTFWLATYQTSFITWSWYMGYTSLPVSPKCVICFLLVTFYYRPPPPPRLFVMLMVKLPRSTARSLLSSRPKSSVVPVVPDVNREKIFVFHNLHLKFIFWLRVATILKPNSDHVENMKKRIPHLY